MKTKLLFDQEAKDKLLNGVEILSRAVGTTLGPRGMNVAIAKADPRGEIFDRSVLHDGVSVAKSIDLEDEFENMGAQLLKQAAQKQVQDVGDGTTLAVILAEAILKQINLRVAAGANPMELRKPIEDSIQILVEQIKRQAIPITTLEQKEQIATISAEDPELGKLVAETVDKMGVDGIVAVEESKNSLTTVDHQEGMQLEKGLQHLLFVTNPERMEAILENPLIMVTDKDITTLEPLAKLLNDIATRGEKLVIVCNPMPESSKAALVENKLRGVLPNMVIFAPSFGIDQEGILGDIAILTGGRFITKDAGHKFEDVILSDLGRADYVSANKSDALIVGGKGNPDDIKTRIEQIKTQIETEDQEFNIEKLKERLAKLTNGVSVIKVGGATEVEMKERVERVKDAVEATKAAIKDGIVPGGETIFLRIREFLDEEDLLFDVLYEPFKKLLNNAGLNDGQLLERLSAIQFLDYGVDVTTGEIKDMVKSGIVDPAAVPIQALINASSVAIQLATTGAIVIPVKDAVSQLQNK